MVKISCSHRLYFGLLVGSIPRPLSHLFELMFGSIPHPVGLHFRLRVAYIPIYAMGIVLGMDIIPIYAMGIAG